MTIIQNFLKPTLIIVCSLLILVSLAYLPIEKDFPDYLSLLENSDLALQTIYYLLTSYVIFLLFKSNKRLIIKILISFLILFLIPQVSMIILLVVDKEINNLIKPS